MSTPTPQGERSAVEYANARLRVQSCFEADCITEAERDLLIRALRTQEAVDWIEANCRESVFNLSCYGHGPASDHWIISDRNGVIDSGTTLPKAVAALRQKLGGGA